MAEKQLSGWANTHVGEIADLLRGITYQKEQASNTPKKGYKPVLRANNINGSLNFDDLVYVPEQNINEQQFLKAGDIVFAMSSGSKHLVGKSAQSKADFDGSYGAFCAALRTSKLVSKDYVYYVFQGNNFRRLISEIAKGSNINNLKREHILDFEITLPPIAEQHRIVAKIEELFSELDKGIENLKTAREQLKVYRQALLKHAFEGKLTAAWREERRANATSTVIPAPPREEGGQEIVGRVSTRHVGLKPDLQDSGLRRNDEPLETAAALLARIQTEREQRYQQQLQQWEQSKSPSVPLLQRGKTSSAAATLVPHFGKGGLGGISEGRGDFSARTAKPKAPKPLPPLTAEELAELPELPEGWGWELIGRFTEVKGGKRLPAGADYSEHPTAHPYIRVLDFDGFSVRTTGLKYISAETQRQISQYTISATDTYISIAGTIGRVGTIPQLLEGSNLTENAAKICGTGIVNNKYLAFWLHSVGGNSQIVERTISTTQPKLALFRIEKVAVPVCSVEEQRLIVEYIEARLSQTDQLDQTLTASLQQAEALRQSILKKAFAGTLVTQDANDEPAAALLARIKAERAVSAKNARTDTKPGKTTRGK